MLARKKIFLYIHYTLCNTLHGQIKGYCRAVYLTLLCYQSNIYILPLPFMWNRNFNSIYSRPRDFYLWY